MVPDKFNMVDMGGIDLIMMQGEEVPGLYNRLVESIAQCRYQCLYNWLFDGVIIPPTYVEMEVNDNDEVVINGGITVTDEDILHIYSLEIPIPPSIASLSITENGEYVAPSGIDGYSPITVSIPNPPLQTKTVIENGIVVPDSGYYGLSSVEVNVPTGGSNVIDLSLLSNNDFNFASAAGGNVNARISAGSGVGQRNYSYTATEYVGNVYGNTTLINNCGLVLLADCSQGASSAVLSDSLNNYTGVVLQGVYNGQRTSSYNTSMLYLFPSYGTAYWAGMKDRNTNHTSYITFTDDTHATITGKKMVIIYGIT